MPRKLHGLPPYSGRTRPSSFDDSFFTLRSKLSNIPAIICPIRQQAQHASSYPPVRQETCADLTQVALSGFNASPNF